VNLFAAGLLRPSVSGNLNMEGAYTEALGDLVGSMGVIAAAIVYITTGWAQADPLVAIAIGLWIVPRALKLGRKAMAILVQSAPARMDLAALRLDLAAIEGVTDVHDLHVWTLTSDMDVATAHLVVSDVADSHRVLDQAGDSLRNRWRISHATLQVEPESHRECVEETW
jgi:cobalt-zinc-cadmium efflux system protein